jgi:serine/threonine protein kinase
VVRCGVRAECLNEETVVRFFRGELSSVELSTVDHHIDGCSVCRVLLSSLASGEMVSSAFAPTELASGLRHGLPPSGTDPNPSSFPQLSPGTVLSDRFVVETLIGAGGMAHVFRGLDRHTGAQVAIKAIVGHTAEEIQRFEREAHVLMSLEHPGIVRYVQHDRGPHGAPYLVMEWLEGEDLASRLQRGPLSIPETVVLGVRVASALAATHELGIVHRDIKPSNLFLPSGKVEQSTVLDYGVARPSWQHAASQATRTGTLLGTLGYMAPEQALGAKTADHRADIFSLGCVLFECLVGKRLFGGAHAVEVLANLLTQSIEHPRSLRPEVPEALDALVVRMLSRDVSARPSSCSLLARELEQSILPAAAITSTIRSMRARSVLAIVMAAVVLVPLVGWLASRLETPRAGPETHLSSSGPAAIEAPASTVVGRSVLPEDASAAASAVSTNAPPTSAPSTNPATSGAAEAQPAPSHDPRPKRTSRTEPDPFGTYRN